jgi:hypothetical protein
MRFSTETYEHTINGLLQKRRELMQEMAILREQLGGLTNDVQAIDHVLGKLGYVGPELEEKAKPPRLVLFYRGQLQQLLLNALRERGTATTRDLALMVMKLEEKDLTDQRTLNDLMNRVGKALGRLYDAKAVAFTKGPQKNSNIWRVSE